MARISITLDEKVLNKVNNWVANWEEGEAKHNRSLYIAKILDAYTPEEPPQ